MSNICYSNGISLYCFSCRYMPVTVPFFYSFINDHPVHITIDNSSTGLDTDIVEKIRSCSFFYDGFLHNKSRGSV